MVLTFALTLYFMTFSRHLLDRW